MLYRLVIDFVQKQNNFIRLEPSQEHYLRRVVRLNNGQDFIAMDGRGNGWRVTLTPEGGEIVNSVEENTELPCNVTLIVALPKGDGFEDIIRCTTELGVNCLQPVISERTILKPKENKVERWRKIAQESAEQSERQIVPYIASPVPVTEIFEHFKGIDCSKYIASPRTNAPHLWRCLQEKPSSQEIVIATGCEGGWTPQEVTKAIDCSFLEVSLGERILRAVTAPIMAMALIASLQESN